MKPENTETPAAPAGPGPEVVAPTSSALLDFVENRAHATPNTSADPSLLQQPLGEAPIGMASASVEEDPLKEIDSARAAKGQAAGPGTGTSSKGGSGKAPGGKGGPAENFSNPDLKGLSPEKSREAAENLAKLLVQGYCRLTDFADKQLQVSEKKMLKIRAAGKIDMETPIPIQDGEVSFEEFIRTYNQQAQGTLAVEPEFIEDILPRLTSVLAKRGQGLSDEQYLLGAVGAHVGINAQKFFAMQSTLKSFMAFGMEMTKRNRDGQPTYARQQEQYSPPPPPPPQSAPPPPPSSPPPAPAPVVSMYDGYDTGGAATNFAMPAWGGKDKEKVLKKAAKKGQQKTSQQVRSAARPISATAPSSRKKFPRKTTTKAS